MNQFRSIDFKNNENALRIAIDFDYILNNLWSTYSEGKCVRRWREMASKIPSVFYMSISIEISHVRCGHGREQALMAVKEEMTQCLKYLIG